MNSPLVMRACAAASVAACTFALPVSAQRAGANSAADTSFAVSRHGVIDITLRSGRLVVRGGDRNNAELRATRTNYDLRSSGVSVTLAVTADRRTGGRRSSDRDTDDPDLELLVPRGVRLVVHGTSTDVNVSDVSGDVDLHLLSGDIQLSSLGGRAIVETVSGDVTATDVAGDLRVVTVSGEIRARGLRGAIDVNTTSGDITLAGERITQLRVDAVSSDIVFDGSMGDDARVQVSTHSGDVTLRLPETAGGILDVSTFNGDVRGGTMTLLPSGEQRTGFTRQDRSSRRFEFGGGGSARITITTFNGDVTLQRGARRRLD